MTQHITCLSMDCSECNCGHCDTPQLLDRPMLTLKETAKLMGTHMNTLRNWDNSGKLVAVRLGSRGDRRYLLSDIIKFINRYDKKESTTQSNDPGPESV